MEQMTRFYFPLFCLGFPLFLWVFFDYNQSVLPTSDPTIRPEKINAALVLSSLSVQSPSLIRTLALPVAQFLLR